MVVDASGNVFIADYGNFRVREVNHLTGVITTVAGNGVGGFSGDGGLAVSAELSGASLALDAAGNLFIVDFGNNRIREVNHVTGLITTIAGNGSSTNDNIPAASAALNQPDELAMDSAGDLFLLDGGTNRVREIAAIGSTTVPATDHLVVTATERIRPGPRSPSRCRRWTRTITSTRISPARCISPAATPRPCCRPTPSSPAGWGPSPSPCARLAIRLFPPPVRRRRAAAPACR